MPTFHFQLLDHDGVQPTGMSYEFDSQEAAIAEARTALAEMAADGLPTGDYNMLRSISSTSNGNQSAKSSTFWKRST
jgi:hypothetical protein